MKTVTTRLSPATPGYAYMNRILKVDLSTMEVRAQESRGGIDRHAHPLDRRGAQRLIGRHAAGEQQRRHVKRLGGPRCLGREHVDHRRLEAGGQVGQ